MMRRKRKFWTREHIEFVRLSYPDMDTREIGRLIGRSRASIYQLADKLGVRKSAAYIQGKRAREKKLLTRVGVTHRFPRGHVPFNAGLRRPGWSAGRMQETQFRKGTLNGRAAQLHVQIGSLRVNHDGYLDRKVREDGPARKRWVSVHRQVWADAHGPIPPGHAVAFKPGRKTTELEKITLDALELVSRQELMRRNSYHTRYPKEIRRLIQLRGALMRQINKRERREKQD